MTGSRTALLLIGCAIAACSHPTTTASPSSCAATPGDSATTRPGAVFRDCDVTVRARAIDRPMTMDFQAPETGEAQSCFSAELEFVVDTTGRPEVQTMKIVRTNNLPYAQWAMSAISQWRYSPAQLNGVPVRQIVHEKPMHTRQIVYARAGERPRPPRPKRC